LFFFLALLGLYNKPKYNSGELTEVGLYIIVIGLFSPSLKAVVRCATLAIRIGSINSDPVNDSLICIDIDNFNALLNRTLYNDACV